MGQSAVCQTLLWIGVLSFRVHQSPLTGLLEWLLSHTPKCLVGPQTYISNKFPFDTEAPGLDHTPRTLLLMVVLLKKSQWIWISIFYISSFSPDRLYTLNSKIQEVQNSKAKVKLKVKTYLAGSGLIIKRTSVSEIAISFLLTNLGTSNQHVLVCCEECQKSSYSSLIKFLK